MTALPSDEEIASPAQCGADEGALLRGEVERLPGDMEQLRGPVRAAQTSHDELRAHGKLRWLIVELFEILPWCDCPTFDERMCTNCARVVEIRRALLGEPAP